MSILRKFINDNKVDNRKDRKKKLTLAIALSTTAGILTGIAVNSKSDKISNIIKKIKNKSTEYIADGKSQTKDLLKEQK